MGKPGKKKNVGVGVDFKRVRGKVGKKLPRAVNATDTTVKAKAISLREQSVAVERGGAALTSRGLTLRETLSQLSHPAARVRRDALVGLGELCASSPEAVRASGSAALAAAAALASDEDADVRKELARVAGDALFPTLGAPALRASLPLLVARVSAALTHHRPGVRRDALRLLEIVAERVPGEVAREHAAPALEHFAAMLSHASRGATLSAGSLSSIATALAGLRSFLDRIVAEVRRRAEQDSADAAGATPPPSGVDAGAAGAKPLADATAGRAGRARELRAAEVVRAPCASAPSPPVLEALARAEAGEWRLADLAAASAHALDARASVARVRAAAPPLAAGDAACFAAVASLDAPSGFGPPDPVPLAPGADALPADARAAAGELVPALVLAWQSCGAAGEELDEASGASAAAAAADAAHALRAALLLAPPGELRVRRAREVAEAVAKRFPLRAAADRESDGASTLAGPGKAVAAPPPSAAEDAAAARTRLNAAAAALLEAALPAAELTLPPSASRAQIAAAQGMSPVAVAKTRRRLATWYLAVLRDDDGGAAAAARATLDAEVYAAALDGALAPEAAAPDQVLDATWALWRRGAARRPELAALLLGRWRALLCGERAFAPVSLAHARRWLEAAPATLWEARKRLGELDWRAAALAALALLRDPALRAAPLADAGSDGPAAALAAMQPHLRAVLCAAEPDAAPPAFGLGPWASEAAVSAALLSPELSDEVASSAVALATNARVPVRSVRSLLCGVAAHPSCVWADGEPSPALARAAKALARVATAAWPEAAPGRCAELVDGVADAVLGSGPQRAGATLGLVLEEAAALCAAAKGSKRRRRATLSACRALLPVVARVARATTAGASGVDRSDVVGLALGRLAWAAAEEREAAAAREAAGEGPAPAVVAAATPVSAAATSVAEALVDVEQMASASWESLNALLLGARAVAAGSASEEVFDARWSPGEEVEPLGPLAARLAAHLYSRSGLPHAQSGCVPLPELAALVRAARRARASEAAAQAA